MARELQAMADKAGVPVYAVIEPDETVLITSDLSKTTGLGKVWTVHPRRKRPKPKGFG